jgi:hypothetical protein
MPRIARTVFAGVPHHITQRGNRRAEVFFEDVDRSRYLEISNTWNGSANAICISDPSADLQSQKKGSVPFPMTSGMEQQKTCMRESSFYEELVTS